MNLTKNLRTVVQTRHTPGFLRAMATKSATSNSRKMLASHATSKTGEMKTNVGTKTFPLRERDTKPNQIGLSDLQMCQNTLLHNTTNQNCNFMRHSDTDPHTGECQLQ